MNAGQSLASGQLADLGWGEVEDGLGLGTTTNVALLALVLGGYWGSVWIVSGLAPLAYAASHMQWRGRGRRGSAKALAGGQFST